MTVTILGASIEITSGTLIFLVAAVVAWIVVHRKMAPAVPPTPGAVPHSTGERAVAGATVAAAVIAIGVFVTGGVTATKASDDTPPPTKTSQPPTPTSSTR
ncbi:hypothetical protein ACFY8O_34060 [Streptomyces argenteolus]|uniref:Uncharacterized protein n=1 Tax=Streptomyces argenteolus TaxID=67274 RepID=A0ABW6XGP5_9ACTN